MKLKVASFEEFAYACQYSTSEYDVNNGYGCSHPDQEETNPDENDIERGMLTLCMIGITTPIENQYLYRVFKTSLVLKFTARS